jgi:RNA-directed DNA polymerase
MDISQLHIDQIKRQFAAVDSREQLLELLNVINIAIYGESTRPIHHKSLTYYTNPNYSHKHYKVFVIPKKSGGSRTIHAPAGGLRTLQRSIATLLQIVYTPHKKATGFIIGRNVAINALNHTKKNYVFNVDLKDFFHAVDQARFWKRLQFPPFNLTGSEGRKDLANRIASLCFTKLEVERNLNGQTVVQERNVLPQGAPTSPVITNIIAERLDRKLHKLAKSYNCEYSRYADDITFSADHNVFTKDHTFRLALDRIIKEENFRINSEKTRLQRKEDRQEVTGLIVNEKVNVPRKMVKDIRMWLYLWEKYGYEHASNKFVSDYFKQKGHLNPNGAPLDNVLSGKLSYMSMVKGKGDPTYAGLKSRFDKLIGKKARSVNEQADLRSVLDIWEKEGIEAAEKLYYGG